MAITKTQSIHLMDRVDNLRQQIHKQIIEKNTKPEVTLSSAERFKLIQTGKVKLDPRVDEIDLHDRVHQLFDFSKFETEQETDKKAVDKAYKAVLKRVNQIKDKIILGDAEAAVKAIAELEKEFE